MMQETQTTSLVFHCARCGGSGPADKAHKCRKLTRRERRRLEASRRAVRETRVHCNDCPPGYTGRCPGHFHPDPRPGEGLAEVLRAEGYDLRKR